MGGPSVAMDTACHQTALCRTAPYKDLQDLRISKNLLFNVKKLLNDGVYLTLGLSGGKKQCQQKEQQALWIYAADRWFLLVNESMMRQKWSPGSTGYTVCVIEIKSTLMCYLINPAKQNVFFIFIRTYTRHIQTQKNCRGLQLSGMMQSKY